TTQNSRNEQRYRISPYVDREVARDTTLRARYDAEVVSNASGSGSRQDLRNGVIRLERKPVPLGASLELSRQDTETEGATVSRTTIDTVRAIANLDVGKDLILGVLGGTDHSQFFLSDHTDPLYGIMARWTPSPRTDLSAQLEHRFFGGGGFVTM